MASVCLCICTCQVSSLKPMVRLRSVVHIFHLLLPLQCIRKCIERITAHWHSIPGAESACAVRRAELADACHAAAVAVEQQRRPAGVQPGAPGGRRHGPAPPEPGLPPGRRQQRRPRLSAPPGHQHPGALPCLPQPCPGPPPGNQACEAWPIAGGIRRQLLGPKPELSLDTRLQVRCSRSLLPRPRAMQ